MGVHCGYAGAHCAYAGVVRGGFGGTAHEAGTSAPISFVAATYSWYRDATSPGGRYLFTKFVIWDVPAEVISKVQGVLPPEPSNQFLKVSSSLSGGPSSESTESVSLDASGMLGRSATPPRTYLNHLLQFVVACWVVLMSAAISMTVSLGAATAA